MTMQVPMSFVPDGLVGDGGAALGDLERDLDFRGFLMSGFLEDGAGMMRVRLAVASARSRSL